MKQLDGFQKYLTQQMLLVIPKKMFRKTLSGESRSYFYELVCSKACLRQESKDVKAAFNYLMEKV